MARNADSVEDQSRRQQGVFVFVDTARNSIREDNRLAAGGVDAPPQPHEVKFCIPDTQHQRATVYGAGVRVPTDRGLAVRASIQRMRGRRQLTDRELAVIARIEAGVQQ
jgi:hypothetical protein